MEDKLKLIDKYENHLLDHIGKEKVLKLLRKLVKEPDNNVSYSSLNDFISFMELTEYLGCSEIELKNSIIGVKWDRPLVFNGDEYVRNTQISADFLGDGNIQFIISEYYDKDYIVEHIRGITNRIHFRDTIKLFGVNI